jgi:hypothetical protein
MRKHHTLEQYEGYLKDYVAYIIENQTLRNLEIATYIHSNNPHLIRHHHDWQGKTLWEPRVMQEYDHIRAIMNHVSYFKRRYLRKGTIKYQYQFDLGD